MDHRHIGLLQMVIGLLHAILLRDASQGTEVGRKFRIRRWHRALPRIIFALLFFIVRHVLLHLFVARLVQLFRHLFHPIQAHSLRDNLSVLAFLSRAEAMAPRFFSSSLLLAMFDTVLSLQLYLLAIMLRRVFWRSSSTTSSFCARIRRPQDLLAAFLAPPGPPFPDAALPSLRLPVVAWEDCLATTHVEQMHCISVSSSWSTSQQLPWSRPPHPPRHVWPSGSSGVLSCHRHSSPTAQGIAPLVVAGYCCTAALCFKYGLLSVCVREKGVC